MEEFFALMIWCAIDIKNLRRNCTFLNYSFQVCSDHEENCSFWITVFQVSSGHKLCIVLARGCGRQNIQRVWCSSPMEVLRKNVWLWIAQQGRLVVRGQSNNLMIVKGLALHLCFQDFLLIVVYWSCGAAAARKGDLQLHSCNNCHKGFVLHYMAREVNVIMH
jgi:hypothetical protein